MSIDQKLLNDVNDPDLLKMVIPDDETWRRNQAQPFQ